MYGEYVLTLGNVLQAVVDAGLSEVSLSQHLLVIQLLQLYQQLVHDLQCRSRLFLLL